MGTWGAGMLDNDVAIDALATFDDQIADGASVEDAVRAVIDQNEDLLEDEDERADLILALAWLTGEQQGTPEWLVAEARGVVADEVALRRWVDSDKYENRKAEEALLLDILDGRRPHPGRSMGLDPS